MKDVGYLISTVSVFLLGAAAWPKADDPPGKLWLVIGGMTASIIGMFLRFLSHRRQAAKREQSGRT